MVSTTAANPVGGKGPPCLGRRERAQASAAFLVCIRQNRTQGKAPGPGALLATLIGWQAAGWLGVVTVSLAFFLPSSMMVYVAAHFWNRWRGSAWHTAVEDGFAPIAAALVLAGAFAILQAGGTDPLAWGTALWVAGCRLWRPNLHPLVLLGVGAALFAIGRSIGVHG